MKRTAIWASLFTLISSSHMAIADSKPVVEKPTPNQTTPAPESMLPAKPAPAAQPMPAKLDCNYQIPADQKTVDQNLVMKWAQNATIQAFSFDHAQVDNQIKALENCFTKQGWKGFNDALKKSGNLKIIKSDKLNVSSSLKGQPQMVDNQDNQWKFSFPMSVVYQNGKEKLSQELDVSVLVARKENGGLGIIQLVAMPKQSMNQKPKNAESTEQTQPTEAKQN